MSRRKGEIYNSLKSWSWVVLCTVTIFCTVPVARGLQKYVYETVGKEFFTYGVIFMLLVAAGGCAWFMVNRLRVQRRSQYVWLFLSASLYLYGAYHLRKHPEEAVHLLEYGLLAFLVFQALGKRVRDWSVYVSTALVVLFVGTLDEYIQWLMPGRVWDYRDVTINALAGAVFTFTIYKVLGPVRESMPTQKGSVKLMAALLTLNALFLGICLSSTPENVRKITSAVNALTWIEKEEVMSEYGHAIHDDEIGTLYSRFSRDRLLEIDYKYGEAYGRVLSQHLSSDRNFRELIEEYSPYENAFLYEFLLHLDRRENDYREYFAAPSQHIRNDKGNSAYREHLITTKYFGKTLNHTGLNWTESKRNELAEYAHLWNEHYSSRTGKMIVWFNLKTVWACIISVLILTWGYAWLVTKRG